MYITLHCMHACTHTYCTYIQTYIHNTSPFIKVYTYIHTYIHTCKHNSYILYTYIHLCRNLNALKVRMFNAESSLQSLVQDRKAVLGFIDPNLITRPDNQTVSFSPQRKILTPPHNNNNNNNRNSSSKKQGRKDIRSPVNLTPLPNIRSISLSELPELILTRPPTFH